MEAEQELSDPWTLFTDGSSCVDGSGAGLILTDPEDAEFTYALRFRFDATNNEAEYEALIACLRTAEQMGVKNIQVSVDSRLVANQVNGSYIAKEPVMILYLEKVKTLFDSFEKFSIKQVPISENKKADALSDSADLHALNFIMWELRLCVESFCYVALSLVGRDGASAQLLSTYRHGTTDRAGEVDGGWFIDVRGDERSDKYKSQNLEPTKARRTRGQVTEEDPEMFGEDAIPRPSGAPRKTKSQRSSASSSATSSSSKTRVTDLMQEQILINREAKKESMDRELAARLAVCEIQKRNEDLKILTFDTTGMAPEDTAKIEALKEKTRATYFNF
ncbi:reverse transcriptase domain-containing protein [Tanacetum coccineum]